MRLNGYDTGGFYDEMFDAAGRPRPEAQLLLDTIGGLGEGQLQRCQQAAERILVQLGITFNVYGDARRHRARRFPSTSCRASSARRSGTGSSAGLRQRIHALNLFIDDVYHEQRILKDGVVPRGAGALGARSTARSASA